MQGGNIYKKANKEKLVSPIVELYTCMFAAELR